MFKSKSLTPFVLLGLATWPAPAPAGMPPVETLADGPAGPFVFRSATISPQQFLTGRRDGAAALVGGRLRLPDGGAERFPAAILVHGSGGVGRHHARWAAVLHAMGIGAFVLDSFTGRGIITTVRDQSQLSSLSMIVDAYRALDLLATHPRIDPTRIALMGWSKGGVVSLYGSLARFRRMHGPVRAEFAAYLAFYPFCNFAFVDDTDVADRPIRIFHGAVDDWVPVASCQTYVDRLRAAGRNVAIRVYPGAPHGFDNPALPPRRRLPHAQNPHDCFLIERPGGVLINRDSEQPFSLTNQCMTRGATIGHHAPAYRQALEDVKALLTDTFRLE